MSEADYKGKFESCMAQLEIEEMKVKRLRGILQKELEKKLGDSLRGIEECDSAIKTALSKIETICYPLPEELKDKQERARNIIDNYLLDTVRLLESRKKEIREGKY